jgi:metal-responsive CopG/Arc/MetJ family transcriptional regulator
LNYINLYIKGSALKRVEIRISEELYWKLEEERVKARCEDLSEIIERLLRKALDMKETAKLNEKTIDECISKVDVSTLRGVCLTSYNLNTSTNIIQYQNLFKQITDKTICSRGGIRETTT